MLFRSYSFRAEIDGTFPEYLYPADEVLTIKAGAQIMFLKNDPSSEKRYYNGMIGEVAAVNDAGMIVRGKDNGDEFQLLPEEWGNYKYVLNEETKEITEEIEGTFRQYPIRLAWAITIHKSQGLTFERAIIDARNSFAHGQTYVALSRCKTLEGMVLESPLRREAIISDSTVDDFTKEVERNKPGNRQLHDMQKAYFFDLLSDLFNFYSLDQAYKRLLRLIDEDLYKLYPKQLAEYKELAPHIKEKIVEVSQRFRNQYTRLINGSDDYAADQGLQERVRSGAGYFRKELEPVRALFEKTNMPLDNKELRKQLNERLQALDDALWIKESLLDARSATAEMAELARVGVMQAMSLTHDWNDTLAQKVREEETQVDRYEDALGTYLVKLSSRELNHADSQSVNTLLHTISDFERISDHSVNLMESAEEMHTKEIQFSQDARDELQVLEDAVQDILNRTTDAFRKGDLHLASKVEPLEAVVNELVRAIKAHHIARLQAGSCSIEYGFVLDDLLTNYERVCDHCSNVAVAQIEVAQDSFDTHAYLNELRHGNDTKESEEFHRRLDRYRERYLFPENQSAEDFDK